MAAASESDDDFSQSSSVELGDEGEDDEYEYADSLSNASSGIETVLPTSRTSLGVGFGGAVGDDLARQVRRRAHRVCREQQRPCACGARLTPPASCDNRALRVALQTRELSAMQLACERQLSRVRARAREAAHEARARERQLRRALSQRSEALEILRAELSTVLIRLEDSEAGARTLHDALQQHRGEVARLRAALAERDRHLAATDASVRELSIRLETATAEAVMARDASAATHAEAELSHARALAAARADADAARVGAEAARSAAIAEAAAARSDAAAALAAARADADAALSAARADAASSRGDADAAHRAALADATAALGAARAEIAAARAEAAAALGVARADADAALSAARAVADATLRTLRAESDAARADAAAALRAAHDVAAATRADADAAVRAAVARTDAAAVDLARLGALTRVAAFEQLRSPDASTAPPSATRGLGRGAARAGALARDRGGDDGDGSDDVERGRQLAATGVAGITASAQRARRSGDVTGDGGAARRGADDRERVPALGGRVGARLASHWNGLGGAPGDSIRLLLLDWARRARAHARAHDAWRALIARATDAAHSARRLERADARNVRWARFARRQLLARVRAPSASVERTLLGLLVSHWRLLAQGGQLAAHCHALEAQRQNLTTAHAGAWWAVGADDGYETAARR
jgi:hypothetical protein